MNKITMKLQADHLIMEALKEDISSEDVSTNAVMKEAVPGEVDLICKEDGIIAGLDVFSRGKIRTAYGKGEGRYQSASFRRACGS